MHHGAAALRDHPHLRNPSPCMQGVGPKCLDSAQRPVWRNPLYDETRFMAYSSLTVGSWFVFHWIRKMGFGESAEIDANVGGEVAVKVGRKMRKLGESHQVLCITHLPQVAAAASRQFAVMKNYDGKRTSTSVDLLGKADRERELARMLGGTDSGSALAHARSLLTAAG